MVLADCHQTLAGHETAMSHRCPAMLYVLMPVSWPTESALARCSMGGSIRERESSVGSIRRGVPPPAHHSRRARDLWSLVHMRLVAMIRIRNAMQDKN